MKVKLLVGLFLAMSVSAFGVEEMSEFERGFIAGKNSCESSPAPTAGVNCRVTSNTYATVATSGRTKAEALLKVDPKYLAEAYANGNVSCIPF